MSEMDPTPELPDDTPIERVRLSTRILNVLKAGGVKTVGEVRETSGETLRSFQDLGPGSVAHLREKLGQPSTDGVRPVGKAKENMSATSATRQRELACAIVIGTSGKFLLQQRDDIARILYPGRIALFGGHREGDETYLECVIREVHEELSYFVPAERFQYLARLEGSDIEVDGGILRAEFFIVRDIPTSALVITEGSLLIIDPNEIIEIEPKLTPLARFALKVYFDKLLDR